MYVRRALAVAWIVTALLHAHIYLFPLFRRCGFSDSSFRLLAFADPQLEGDTSVWHAPQDALFRPAVFKRWWQEGHRITLIRSATSQAYAALPHQLRSWRKRIDLVGNDFYLAHIYRVLAFWTRPTHVAVLGDLLGSQWIGDEEFERRAHRFWHRVFRGGLRVDDAITVARTDESLGADPRWRRRIINVAGNHDVGYAGNLTPERLARFEQAFGRANWEIAFHDDHSSLRIVILNSMNLDTPARSKELQTDTYDFINNVIRMSKPVDDRTVGTILLTHIPLPKAAGICVDGPFFAYDSDDLHGLTEQNHLSDHSGRTILEGIFGMRDTGGRTGLIINGHDHEGCDVYHYKDDQWHATPYATANLSQPGIREVTMRSMMGEFGGYSYTIGARFDGEWRFDVDRCTAGVQHWWWAAQIMLLVSLAASGPAMLY